MKVMVAVKWVVDYAVEIRVKPETKREDVDESILRDRPPPPRRSSPSPSAPHNAPTPTLRSTLAIGADRAVHVDTGTRPLLLPGLSGN